MNRRLTLNYGLRWEPYLAIYYKQGQIHYVDPELFTQGYRSPVFSNAPAGVIFPGDPHYVCGRSFSCDKWMDFFPRVGLAFDPKGDGKMTIRASYGMSGDRPHMFYPNQMSFGPPFGNTIQQSIDHRYRNGNHGPNGESGIAGRICGKQGSNVCSVRHLLE